MKLNRELHHIQRHILQVLGRCEWARYRDLKLPGVESSLYNYHLHEMMKTGLVEKATGKGYRLSPQGLRYVDHVSLTSFEPRWQPKIINTFVIENEFGETLLCHKMRQPFFGQLNLPSGKMHHEDQSVLTAAERELGMILDGSGYRYDYRGIVDFRAIINDDTVSHTIYFIHSVRITSLLTVESNYSWHTIDMAVPQGYTPHAVPVIELVRSGRQGFLECITVRRTG